MDITKHFTVNKLLLDAMQGVQLPICTKGILILCIDYVPRLWKFNFHLRLVSIIVSTQAHTMACAEILVLFICKTWANSVECKTSICWLSLIAPWVDGELLQSYSHSAVAWDFQDLDPARLKGFIGHLFLNQKKEIEFFLVSWRQYSYLHMHY